MDDEHPTLTIGIFVNRIERPQFNDTLNVEGLDLSSQDNGDRISKLVQSISSLSIDDSFLCDR